MKIEKEKPATTGKNLDGHTPMMKGRFRVY